MGGEADFIQSCFFRVQDRNLLIAALSRALGSPFSTSISICLKQILSAIETANSLRELTLFLSPAQQGWITVFPREEQLTTSTIQRLSEELETVAVNVAREDLPNSLRCECFENGIAQIAQRITEEAPLLNNFLVSQNVIGSPHSYLSWQASEDESREDWLKKRYRIG